MSAAVRVGRVTGLAIPYLVPAVIGTQYGSFRETWMPGSLASALAGVSARAGSPIYSLWNHDEREVLGSTASGALSLGDSPEGLRFALDVADVQRGRDAFELVRRGDVNGVSIAFRAADAGDEWIEDPDGLPHRMVRRAELYEVSLVTWPAFSSTYASAGGGDLGRGADPRYDRQRRRLQLILASTPRLDARVSGNLRRLVAEAKAQPRRTFPATVRVAP